MREFQQVKHSDSPYQYPVILKPLNMDRLFHYKLTAQRLFGDMENGGSNGSRWFYARGYFFFANEKLAREFELAARPVPSAVDPNWFNAAINRIYKEFA